MQIEKNLKILSLSLIIFTLPFLDFIKVNFNELDIIIGKSFYFLIAILASLLLTLTYIITFFLKKFNFYNTLLFVVLLFWLFFKHNLLNLLIKNFLNKLNIINAEYSSEISLIILIVLSFYFFKLIYKKKVFFIRFLYIFFFLSFFTSIIKIIIFEPVNQIDHKVIKSNINFPDNLKNEKKNIYFFILDGMQPIKGFEKYYQFDLRSFLKEVENKKYN